MSPIIFFGFFGGIPKIRLFGFFSAPANFFGRIPKKSVTKKIRRNSQKIGDKNIFRLFSAPKINFRLFGLSVTKICLKKGTKNKALLGKLFCYLFQCQIFLVPNHLFFLFIFSLIFRKNFFFSGSYRIFFFSSYLNEYINAKRKGEVVTEKILR